MKARLASAYSRSRLFWLLAEGLLHGFRAESWLYVPDGSEGPGKAGSPLAEAWENLVDLLRTLDDEASARLAVEHTRLFGGLTRRKSASVSNAGFCMDVCLAGYRAGLTVWPTRRRNRCTGRLPG